MEKGKPQQSILAASPTAIWNTNQPNSTISHGQKGKLSNPLKFHEEKTHRRRGTVPLLWDSIPSSGQHRLTTGRLQPSGIRPLSGVQMLTRNSRGWESGGWGWTDPCAEVPVGHWLAEDHTQSPQKCENLQFGIFLLVSYKGIKSVWLLATRLLGSTLHHYISGGPSALLSLISRRS